MSSIQTRAELSQRFAVPEVLAFEEGPGGLVRALITTPQARCVVYLHGAHVAEFQPAGQQPVLFMSQRSNYESGKPIRGGVPLIFPWFGPRPGDAASPMHGLARLTEWKLDGAAVLKPDQEAQLVFSLRDSEASRRIWPHAFQLRFTVTVGSVLRLMLEVHNPGEDALTFEEALHTYFAVSDIRQVALHGLADETYIDKMDGLKRKVEDQQALRLTGETDRVYVNCRTDCTIEDPGLGRKITVEKDGSATTVVWNPWIAKARAMSDFGDEEWPRMLCVETANAVDNAITLWSGERHRMELRIRSTPLSP